MESTVMNYNEPDYQKYYQIGVSMLGDIRLKKLKFVHKMEKFKGKNAHKVEDKEEIKDSLLKTFIAPEEMHEDANNVIDSINITQQLLAASYSLLKLQLDAVNSSKSDDESPEYFWFAFYFEDTVSRISTLNDLLWNFVNYYYDYNKKENSSMIKKVRKALEQDDYTVLVDLLDDNEYETKTIRNHFIHNTKPFLYKGSTTVKDGIIAVGQGTREFNFDKDMYKIDDDIKFLSKKYQDIINELKLETL